MDRRRVVVWLMSVPLMAAGSQVAHALAFWLVYPEGQLRLRELLLTGHGYMRYGLAGRVGYMSLMLGVGGALELVAFGWMVAARLRRRPCVPMPSWAFALLPLIGVSLQEFLERWFAGSSFPWWVVLQPTFRIGLLLQLPFALVAFVLAGLLLRTAERVALGVRTRRPLLPVVAFEAGPGWFALALSPLRVAALAGGHAERGPPLSG